MFRRLWNRLFSRRSTSNRSTARRAKAIARRANRHHLRLEFLESRSLLAASVFSDQPDYAPGSTAYLTATGFAPGEAVSFNITSQTPGPGQGSWTVTDGITDGSSADLDGQLNGIIQTSWLVDPDGAYIGATLLVTATGLSSGEMATTSFTDADNAKPDVSMTAPADNSIVGVSIVTLTANATDNVAVANVQFQISAGGGGAFVNVGAADTTAPYSVQTASLADGTYRARAIATDMSNNSKTSAMISFPPLFAVPLPTCVVPS